MQFLRHYTHANTSPYEGVAFRLYKSPDPEKTSKFDAPVAWSDETITTYYKLASRRSGVPRRTRPVRESDIPRWLWRRVPDRGAQAELTMEDRTGGERSARDVIDRIAGGIAYWGWRGGYFDSENDAATFVDELRYLLCHRHLAFPPDHIRNAGTYWAYGIAGDADRRYVANFRSGRIERADSSHEPHAGPLLADLAMAQAGHEAVFDLCSGRADARGWLRSAGGIRFSRSAAQWHTCPRSGAAGWSPNEPGFVFVSDSACPLLAIDASKFIDRRGKFDIPGFSRAVRIATAALDIALASTSYGSRATATATWNHRPLGLALTNITGLCSGHGVEFNSSAGRALAAAVAALMTGTAYRMSAELASLMGTFPEFEINLRAMQRALRNHRLAVHGRTTGYQGLTRPPVPLDRAACPDDALVAQALSCWDRAVEAGERWGFRNAQVTLVPGARILREFATPVGTAPFGEAEDWDQEAGSMDSQIRMMAAVQPFLSGAIGTAIKLPPQLGFESAAALYQLAWRLGLKGLTLTAPGTADIDGEHAGLRLLSGDGLRRTGSDGAGDAFDT